MPDEIRNSSTWKKGDKIYCICKEVGSRLELNKAYIVERVVPHEFVYIYLDGVPHKYNVSLFVLADIKVDAWKEYIQNRLGSD